MIQHIINRIKVSKYQPTFMERTKFSRFLLWDSIKLLVVAFILSACQNNGPATNGGSPANIPQLIYTKHARCRMECRHINEAEIKEVLAENNINGRKSNPEGKPCPAYAYEGYSNEHQHLRIVIGKCDDRAWKVITCIDLGNEFECDCH
jgi:hypothetical protein